MKIAVQMMQTFMEIWEWRIWKHHFLTQFGVANNSQFEDEITIILSMSWGLETPHQVIWKIHVNILTCL